MSKETAITFVLIFPLILFYFTNKVKKTSISLIYFSISLVFLLFRYLATKENHGIPSADVLNNPFVNATVEQKFSTILLSWLFYLRVLIFPVDLSYDYNFNQFPLSNFYDYLYSWLLKSQIEMDMGNKAAAKADAEKTVSLATDAKSAEYIKLGNEVLNKVK